jgi:hypothetical protein
MGSTIIPVSRDYINPSARRGTDTMLCLWV